MISRQDLSNAEIGQEGAASNVRMRSGSPGNRHNCDKLITESLQAEDPKQFLKVNFKTDMKRFGLNSEMKKLKTFKFALQSRSHEHVDEE